MDKGQLVTTIFADKEVQIHLAFPHKFFQEHQQQLLPDWNDRVTFLILYLQRSRFSLAEVSPKTIQEKDRLRAKFIRFGSNLIFALQDLGYKSDLFDPRTGYPWLTRQGKLTFDDNAAVEALLHYPLKSYKNCSLLYHPSWGNNVYPGIIVTRATQAIVELMTKKNC